MTAHISLNGDIPGLFRRCSPVIYANPALPHITGKGVLCDPCQDDEEFMGTLTPWIGTLVGRDAMQEALGAIAPGFGASAGFGYRMDGATVLALDLEQATGRVHAAWWLSAHGGPTLRRQAGWPVEVVAFVQGSYGWVLTGLRSNHTGWAGHQPRGLQVGPGPRVLACLAGLEPADPRTLADGSLWVDAMALKLIVEHMWKALRAQKQQEGGSK